MDTQDRTAGDYLGALGGRRCYPLLVLLTSTALFFALPSRFSLVPAGGVSHITHGLYVVNLLFFAGTAAGAMILAVLARAVSADWGERTGRLAEATAITCLVLAMIFLALDAAGGRSPHEMFPARFSSPAAWDVAILAMYLGNALALAYFATHVDMLRRLNATVSVSPLRHAAPLMMTVLSATTRPRRRELIARLASAMIPAIVLLGVVPVWILGLLPPTFGWYRLAIAGLFYASSLATSLALVVVAGTLGRVVLGLEFDERLIQRLGSILRIAIPGLGYCLFAEMRCVFYARDPIGHLFHEILVGPYAPFFWFAMGAGVVVPFALLITAASIGVTCAGLAGMSVVLGVLVERWYLVIGTSLGHAHRFYTADGYAPTGPEIEFTMAAYGVGAGMFAMLVWRFVRRGSSSVRRGSP